jgi:hypothetical protein
VSPFVLPVLKAVGLVAASGALAFGVLDWKAAREARGDLKACTRAAVRAEAPPERCPEALALAIRAAQRADACETALAGADLYAIRASCGAEVKRQEAALAAAKAEAASARAALREEQGRFLAAIARAEGRAAALQRSKSDADEAIKGARPGADGLLVCDGECLRRLAGAPASP